MTRQQRRWLVRCVGVAVCGALLAVGLAVVESSPAAAGVPVRCLGSPSVLSVASSYEGNTYALDRNGSLWGWGNNYFGQIGNGDSGFGAQSLYPVNASGFSSLQGVTAGGDFVMALRQDGTVWTWGDGQVGQLGDGQTGSGHIQPTPVPVPGLTDVVALEGGPYNTFAIKADGTVWAWGRNDYGQLGDGTTTDRAVPTQIPALTGFVAVSPSNLFTLALKADGTVWAWGRNNHLQLGGNVAQFDTRLTPVQVPGISSVTAVSAGGDHSVALRSDGTVWSWGYGATGALGNGTWDDTSTPRQASGLTGVAQIAAGGFFTLALKSNGTAWGWGQNIYGEIGNPAANTWQSTPVQVATISSVAAVDSGGNAAVALSSAGQVWDWGMNYYGEVGNGAVNYPIATDNPVRSPYLTAVTQTPPAEPTELSAVAGEGVAYLAWTPPTSAVTQYVVTPYLNGVAQPQVAAAAGSSDYTVSGLTEGGNYSFTVAGQNCLGAGTATDQSNHVIPTGPQLNTSEAKTESSRLTDRASLHVNTFNGNLSVTARDLAVKGTGLDLVLARTYNNLADRTSMFGRNWSSTLGGDVSLEVLGDGSVMFHGPGGYQVGFVENDDGSFTSPSGIDATLAEHPDTTYTLRWHGSGETWDFTAAGQATARHDRNGNTITFTYSGPGGGLSAITDTQGRVTALSYNAAGLVASVTDPAGRVHEYGYDAAGNLITHTDPAGGIMQFAYGTGGNLTQITTPAGRVVALGYDTAGRATSISHPLQAGNPTTTFAYSATSTVVTDANGNPTTYVFDTVGRTTKVLDALGNQTSASYTSNSNVAAYSSGNGTASANFGYDDLNNVDRAAVAPGAHTTLSYDDPDHPHLPTSVTDPQNNTTYRTYDSAGNLTGSGDPPASAVTAVSGGSSHSLAFESDGTTWAWGHNSDGRLGDGTTTSRSTPVPVSALTGIAAISAGDSHSLAVRNDGTGWAWGRNSSMQLGDGTTTNRATPIRISALAGLRAMSAGSNHSLAVKTDGTAWAWGSNFGRLGDGTTTSRWTPVQVSGLTGVAAVSAGWTHSLAVKTDGTVWAWGSNGWGQLGDGTTTSRLTPVQVSGLTGVAAVSAGTLHSLALKTDGTVWAWGDNAYGQLGDGTTTDRTAPVQTNSLTQATAIAAGGYHSLALKTDGTVWAWGSNSDGKLGDGTTTNRSTPVQASGLVDVTAISGGGHSLAVKADGTVWAWGNNTSGELGDGTTTDRSTPVEVDGVAPVSEGDVRVTVTHNADGTVAASTDRNGNVTTYGYDPDGNLTSVTPPSPLGSVSIDYDTLSRVTEVTAGKGQTTAYTYDVLDRVTAVTYEDGSSVTQAFDADGNLTAMTDATGTTTTTYDAMGRLTGRATPDGITVAYGYDGVGNLLTLSDGGGTTSYTYNAVNLPDSVTAPGGVAVAMGYDANYNRTSIAYPGGVTEYSTYDTANRLVNQNTARSCCGTYNSLDYGYTPDGPGDGSARAITMRGAPSTYATSGTASNAVTLATPTGLRAGDVLVAQIAVAAHASISSVPSGWTQVRSDTTGSSANDLRQTLYHRVAGSSEPPRYTWGLNRTTEANGALTVWAGVDGASPVGTSAGRVDGTGHDTYAATVGVDRPAGYWRLGEASGTTAADSSGNGINGSYQGGVTRGQPGGPVGDADTAVSFNGSSGYASVPQSPVLKNPAFSIEGWFKTTSTASSQVIYRWRWEGNGLRLMSGRPRVFFYDAGGGFHSATAPSSYADGHWHHTVGTYDGAALTIYVDGVAVKSTATAAPVRYGTGGTAIGRDGDFSGGYFNGALDEVAVYPGALSAARVAAHHLAGATAPANPPWVAPSVPYQNGELAVALYGGRVTGPGDALDLPEGHTAAYDTQTTGITVGAGSRTLGAMTGSTLLEPADGPPARWVAQQVLLRPEYDSSLRTTTPAGAMTYDTLNRLISGDGYGYTYDATSNRRTQRKDTQGATYTYNAANQLTASTKPILLVGTASGHSVPGSLTFAVALPAGIQSNDQILVGVVQTGADTASVTGYTPAAAAASGTGLTDATTTLYRRTATGTETDVTVTGSAGAIQAAVVAVYRGVDATDPIDAQASAGAPLETTLTVPSLTPSVVNERLVVLHGAVDQTPPGTWTPPSDMIEQAQHTDQPLRSVGLADKALSTTGATGSLTSTISTTEGVGANLAGIGVTLRPATISYAYDANGNLTAASDTASLTYDAADRTTAITALPGGSATTFGYRGPGQTERTTVSPATRVAAACTAIAGCPPSTTSSSSAATFEHSLLGISAETHDTATTYYVRDPQGRLLAQRTPGGTFYYLHDGQGSVVGLTDPSGSVVATYDYDPFGQLTAMTGGSVAVDNPWRYVGAYQDGTGLYKMGARYYDPALGRWTQQDPIHDPFDPKQWNRYVYVGNDPINFVDPYGLNAVSDWFSDRWNDFTGFASKCWSGLGEMFSSGDKAFGIAAGYILTTGLFLEAVHATAVLEKMSHAATQAFLRGSGATLLSGLTIATFVGWACWEGYN